MDTRQVASWSRAAAQEACDDPAGTRRTSGRSLGWQRSHRWRKMGTGDGSKSATACSTSPLCRWLFSTHGVHKAGHWLNELPGERRDPGATDQRGGRMLELLGRGVHRRSDLLGGITRPGGIVCVPLNL